MLDKKEILNYILDNGINVIFIEVYETAIKSIFQDRTAIYYLLDDEFSNRSGSNLAFHRLRIEVEEALEKNDVDLVYSNIEKGFQIEKELCEYLKEKEIEYFVKYYEPRKSIKEIYEFALDNNIEVYFYDDVFDDDAITKLVLQKTGYNDYSKIINAKFIVNSNYKNCIYLGKIPPKINFTNTFYIPTVLDAFFENECIAPFSVSAEKIISKKSIMETPGYETLQKIVANLYFDDISVEWIQNSVFNADAYKAGYYVVGMHMIGVVKWIVKHVQNKKTGMIWFCARDGYLLKQCYDICRKYNKALPVSGYLQASRKLLLPILFSEASDFFQPPINSFKELNPKTFLKLFWNFTNLVKIPEYRQESFCMFENDIKEYFIKHGCEWEKNFQNYWEYSKFVNLFIKKYYSKNNHLNMKDLLKRYYNIISENDVIFDLGYSGRIPKALYEITGKKLYFLYLISDEKNFENIVRQTNLNIDVFYNFTPLCNNLLREFILSENAPSCVGMVETERSFEPVFENDVNEYYYSQAIKNIHQGALDFVNKVFSLFEENLFKLPFKEQEISLPFEGFLRDIKEEDIIMFQDTYQEEYLSGDLMSINWKMLYTEYMLKSEYDLAEYEHKNGEKKEMRENKISVVVTTKNRKYEAARALKSVFEQTVNPYEIIVVDDASNDGTREYLESLNLGQYRYIYNVDAKGLGRSRNIGMIAATGNYIAFLDSRNMWYPKKLEEIKNIWKDNQGADVYCARYKRHCEFSVYETSFELANANLTANEEVLLHNPADASSSIYKKTFLEEVGGFSERYLFNIDWELLLRASKKQTLKLCKLNQVLSENWIMVDSISESSIEEQERMEILHEYKKDLLDNHLEVDFYKQFCMDHPEFSDESEKRNQFFKWVKYDIRWMDVVYNALLEDRNVQNRNAVRKGNFYNFLSNWMEISLRGDSIADPLLEQNVKDVALYGFGKHGKFAYADLKKRAINVCYVIDQEVDNVVRQIDIPVYGIDEDIPKVDAIIVSPYLEYESIKSMLESKVSAKIIALDKLVDQVKQRGEMA